MSPPDLLSDGLKTNIRDHASEGLDTLESSVGRGRKIKRNPRWHEEDCLTNQMRSVRRRSQPTFRTRRMG
jgi:hypothetical protein